MKREHRGTKFLKKKEMVHNNPEQGRDHKKKCAEGPEENFRGKLRKWQRQSKGYIKSGSVLLA